MADPRSRPIEELIEITTALVTERDLTRLLARIVESACRLVHADAGIVSLLDVSKRNLVAEVFRCASMDVRRSDYPIIPLMVDGKRNSSNVCVHCAFTGELIGIADIYQYTGFEFSNVYKFDRASGYRTQSMLAIPLVDHKNITVGVLQLLNGLSDNGKVGPFDEAQKRMAKAFASQAAVAIDNVQLIRENSHLISVLNANNAELANENESLRKVIEGGGDFSQIIGSSDPIRKVFDLIRRVSASDATVLINGETGTGKELVAHALHVNSPRRAAPFVAQNCAALPENLLESELFGFKKGAFSGAVSDKKGLIEEADGGTLFLDEIGDMPLGLQAKILRVLQEKEIRPLGSVTPKKVNVRVVAATHRDLADHAAKGHFREDLYYRLSVFPIHLAALRDRKEDIPALIKHFLTSFAEKYNKSVTGVTPVALDMIMRYEFPGNIRELRNILERGILLCDEGQHISPEQLPAEFRDRRGREETRMAREESPSGVGLKEMVEHYEAKLLRDHLSASGWNQSKVAEELKMGRRTLIEKMGRYGIQKS